MAQDSKTETKKETNPSKRRYIIIGLAVAVILGVGFYMFMHHGEEHTDNAAFEASVVAIAPRINGYVTSLNITDNQIVKKGDVLLTIDPRDYQIARDKNKALLDKAAAEYLRTTTVRERVEKLDAKARAKQDLDDAIAAEKAAKAEFDSASADLAQAEKDLQDTQLTAPMDGRVTERTVETGAYVLPGQQLFSLVGTDLWVVANYKETQLEHIKKGQRVDIEIDSQPDLELTGRIDSIQSGTGSRFSLFPAENATGNFVKIVQRVPVKIILDELPDPEYGLAPGMSVEPTVHTVP